MILWVKRAGLVFGLALLIFSCEDSSQIGLELDPGKGDFVARYAELPLKSSIVQVDSVPTTNSGRILVGHLNDPEFGTVDATGFTRIFMSDKNLELGADAVYDSLVFGLGLNYFYGQDKNAVQRIEVHELAEDLLDTTYFSSNTTAIEPEVLGNAQLDLSYVDTTRIDSTYRVRMSDSFGQRLFQAAKTDTATFLHADNARFVHSFKGLAIKPGDPNSVILGIGPGSSYLVMYYHTSTDTLGYVFRLFDYNQGHANDLTLYYHHLSLDKSGTALSGLESFYKAFYPGDDMSYVQSGTGILTRLSLQPLLDFVDTAGNVILNRAEIEMRSGQYPNYLEPPRYLELSLTNNTNNFIFQNNTRLAVQSEEGKGNLQMVFSRRHGAVNDGFYNGNITQYAQYIINGINSDTVLLVTPSSFISSIDRLTGKNPDLKLKLYYSSSR